MGHVGWKTRSVGQIIEKPCEHSRGHSVGPIFIKLAQNDHLGKYLSQVQICVMWGPKVGHQIK